MGELLAGGVLDLDDTGVFVIVREVYLHGGLVVLLREGFELESQGAIGQGAMDVAKVFVDGAGPDEVVPANGVFNILVGGVEGDLDIRMIQDALDHGGVAVFGEGLEGLGEIPVVTICPHRDAAAYTGVEVLRVALPLFARVVFEEHLVQLPADLRDDDFLGVLRRLNRDTPFVEGLLHFLGSRGAADELLEGVEVDGKLPVTSLGPGEDLVLDGVPFGELAEVVDDPLGV